MRQVAAWLLLPLAAFGGEPPGLRVAGRVVNSLTGAPVAGALVALEKNRSEDQAISIFTGADGRFAFSAVPPGMYALRGQRRGYRTTRLGYSSMGGGVALAVAPGEKNDDVVFPLPPGSAIGGRVLDETGEPVTEALVQLLVSSCADGRRRILPAGYRWTNDLGEYRFSGLPPGMYYLAATATPWYAGRMPGAAFAPRYYGGGGDAGSAAPLPLKEGEDAKADFTMMPATGVTVRLIAPKPGEYVLALTAPGVGGNDLWIRNERSKGRLEIRGVPPGRYWASGKTADGEPAFARKPVDVAGADVQVALEPEPPLLVSGTLRFPDRTGGPAEGARVRLVNDERHRYLERAPGPGGVFVFDRLPAARYKVAVISRDRVYVRRIVAEGAPVDGDALDLARASGTVRVSIDAGDDGGAVRGKVRRGGQPAAGALVVLAPRQDSSLRSDYHLFIADRDGSFDFTGIRPGEYVLFAAGVPELEFANPEAIRPYRAHALVLKVEPNSRHTEDLTLP